MWQHRRVQPGITVNRHGPKPGKREPDGGNPARPQRAWKESTNGNSHRGSRWHAASMPPGPLLDKSNGEDIGRLKCHSIMNSCELREKSAPAL